MRSVKEAGVQNFQKNAVLFAALTTLILTLSGCELVEGIFKAGVWTAVILMAGAFVLGFVVLKLFRRGGRALR